MLFIRGIVGKRILCVKLCRNLRVDRIELLKLFDRIDVPAGLVAHLAQFTPRGFI